MRIPGLKKPNIKIKIWDDSGQPIFKSKGKNAKKMKKEVDDFFDMKF